MNPVSISHADGVAPLAVSPKKAEQILDIGHTRLYQLMNSGELESYLDASSRKITMRSIVAYVERRLNANKVVESEASHAPAA